jgi:dihydroneopterin aldolase
MEVQVMTEKKNNLGNQDKIILKDLRFMGKHGCYEIEKTQAQPFCINITMQLSTVAAAVTDELSLTVDYSQTYNQIKDLVENRSFNLIETLAEQIAALVLEDSVVERVWVEVEKCAATSAGQSFRAAVAIERFVK